MIAKEKEHERSVRKAKTEALSENGIEKMCKIYQLLSDPIRLKIVLALMEGELCVYHLMEVCNVTQSAISHQLRVLRDNNIVKCRRLGQRMEYALADVHIREIVEKGKAHVFCEKV